MTSWSSSRTRSGLDVPLHVDGASGGFVWPFLYPDSEWDFRLEQVRSINASGHKFGLVYPGIGWLVFRETKRPGRGPRLLRELPRQDRRHVHAQLLDRVGDGARPVLQLRALRARRLPLHHGDDAAQRQHAGGEHRRDGPVRADRRRGAEQLPLVAFKLADEKATTSSTSPPSSPRSGAGWSRLHAPTRRRARHDPPRTGQGDARPLARDDARSDIAEACATLEEKGGLHALDRQRVKTGTGY